MSPEEKLEMGRKMVAEAEAEIAAKKRNWPEKIEELMVFKRPDVTPKFDVGAGHLIAQEQRGAMNADEARTREAAMRVWGEHVRGCDTADAMADLIVSQRAELDAVFAAIDEVDAACEDQAFGWSLRKDTARKRLQALRDKRKTGTKR